MTESAASTNDTSDVLSIKTSWKNSLRLAYRDPYELLQHLGLANSHIQLAETTNFPLLVPREFVAKMVHGDPQDPLLRQVLPLVAENNRAPGFVADPNDEASFHHQAGLIQKYARRALIIVSGGCAINCRYCFRRHFPYEEAVGKARLDEAVQSLATSADISEVILSGGDPLLLDDNRLDELVQRIAELKHIVRLRIHTRLPVTIPQRLTDALQRTLSASRLKVVVVLHVNHPNELDAELAARLRNFHNAGVWLFNQSVLLRGVNDSVPTLAELCESLFDANIIPYYVHLLDKVSGSHHFAVSLRKARSLETQLRALLPGYLVPKFVHEVPHAEAKTPLHLL
ncbi:MAG: EF-P beta-lysylation protein EpmB [Gammaproteobacteria bacterium]